MESKNVQLFRDREFSIRFDRWIGSVTDFQGQMIYRLIDDYTSSESMGYIIWDNELSDLARFYSRDFFARNFEAILGALVIAGTYESYITIIRSALGFATSVTFESPSPSHLIINVGDPSEERSLGFYSNNEMSRWKTHNDDFIVAKASTSPLTLNETRALIDMLNVNGVFVEVNFVAAPPVIIIQPQDQEVQDQQPFTFTCVGSSFDSVQWQYRETPASSWADWTTGTFDQESLTDTAELSYHNYEFRAVYTNSNGITSSFEALLQVYPVNTLTDNNGEPMTTNSGEYLTTS